MSSASLRRADVGTWSPAASAAEDELGASCGALSQHSGGRRSTPGQSVTVEPLRLSVVVVDSEQALAEALAAALPSYDGVASASAANDPISAASVMDRTPSDVLVVGVDSQEWDALAFMRWVTRRWPEVAMVALSANDDPDRATAALKAGAMSWVPKYISVRTMAAIVNSAARGESSVPPQLLRQVLRELTHDATPMERVSVFDGLTDREREILEYAVLDFRRGDIARELGLSVNTVRTHMQHILSKLGVHTTLEAVTLVLREQAPAG